MNTIVPTSPILSRHLAIPGTYNMRDVGGYAVPGSQMTRWRTLIRADALHRLDDEGFRMLREIGVHTVLDLRSDDEVRRAPNRLADLEIRALQRPLLGPRPTASLGTPRRTLSEIYLHVVDERPQALVGAVRELSADDAFPAIVHCTIGKDRTGMVVAIILSLLGVDDATIAADFAATEVYLCGAFRDELVVRHAEGGLSVDEVEALLSVDPALILGFLDRVRGSSNDVSTFLGRHGMTERELTALRERLLIGRPTDGPEPPSSATSSPVDGAPRIADRLQPAG